MGLFYLNREWNVCGTKMPESLRDITAVNFGFIRLLHILADSECNLFCQK